MHADVWKSCAFILMPFGRVGRYHSLLLGHRKKCTEITVGKGQCLQKIKKRWGQGHSVLVLCLIWSELSQESLALEPFIIWDKKGGGDIAFSAQENERLNSLSQSTSVTQFRGIYKNTKQDWTALWGISKNSWCYTLLSLRRPHLPWNGLKANILCPQCIGYSSNIFRGYVKHMCVRPFFISLNMVGMKLSGNVYN